jgi:hypothetical protein
MVNQLNNSLPPQRHPPAVTMAIPNGLPPEARSEAAADIFGRRRAPANGACPTHVASA